jgi:S-adenosylmethionine hydrolase
MEPDSIGDGTGRKAGGTMDERPNAARRSPPVISLLTDFGTHDAFVGICKGVILRIAPNAQLVDLTHEIRPFHVRDGALWLRAALPYLPVGVHLAVVDPGVGTERRAIAIQAGRGDFLVGPDNGLLLPGAEALGGAVAAHELTNPAYRLETVSGTFHGRDVFSPAAAHLAMGVPISDLGPSIAMGELVRIEIPRPRGEPGRLTTIALRTDTFGSVETAATQADLEEALGPLIYGDRLRLWVRGVPVVPPLRWVRTFGAVAAGEPLLYVNSYGLFGVAVNLGSAAERFGISDDDDLAVERA